MLQSGCLVAESKLQEFFSQCEVKKKLRMMSIDGSLWRFARCVSRVLLGAPVRDAEPNPQLFLHSLRRQI
jgi:hypothetical protein